MALTRSQIVAVVERSPACVATHDKAGWLALFARDGEVEDPVGSAVSRRGAHPDARGEDDLARFWDSFIAGNAIRFDVRSDLVAGSEMVRDVLIRTTLSSGLQVDVPAYLLYEVVEESGEPRLRRLRACWDLRRRTAAAATSGFAGMKAMASMSARLMKVQRPGWLLDYSRGLTKGAFDAGGRRARAIAGALSNRDPTAFEEGFVRGAEVEVVGQPPLSLCEAFGAWTSLKIDEPITGGWLTGFRFEAARAGGEPTRGVGFLELEPGTGKVARARLFVAG